MVTLKKVGCRTNQQGVYQMEMMIAGVGLVSMMIFSLAFSRASYKKVAITVQK